MILRDLKAYLVGHRRASLSDLSCRFAVEPDALRGMLAHWVAKGQIRAIAGVGPVACGGCCRCPPQGEVYEWVG
jgi:hypothetical protein